MVQQDPVWTADDIESVNACPGCGAAAPRGLVHTGLTDTLEGSPGEWQMRQCADCGSLFLDPRPTPASIHKAYQRYYTHAPSQTQHEGDNGSSALWALANGYMNHRYGGKRQPASALGPWLIPLLPPLRQQLDFFYRHLPSTPGTLLDVGCGNGVFLLRARDAGWQATGLEPDPAAVRAARGNGFDVIEGLIDQVPETRQFDVITVSHVIEHVHDAAHFLAKAQGLLRPGGQLWLSTPNPDSWGHRAYGTAWRGLEPPRHLTVFTARALQQQLAQAGFTAITAHRRGRGSRYILEESRRAAQPPVQRVSPLLADIAGSLFTQIAEETVISARKPS